ncbi:transcriptional repressor [Microbacterium sp. F2E]|uniref:Fur family transcriptional regulator n=1 Tax=Microbacterium sp. F2E TaxID=2895284 RepID=UPI001E57A811|nr:transcriptional repressor [Microbacterium sp. F2E]MCC9053163.1 transcriptional repressor [Microbacterium sp. F2E]
MAQRNTWQRDRVREALGDAAGFVSAQDLHATLRQGGSGIGLATVYRTLATLAASGEADQLQSLEGEAIYRACSSTGHHHHLICRSCGRAVEIEAREVEAWAQRTAAAHGFTQAEHVVDIFGLCGTCTAAQAAPAPVTATAAAGPQGAAATAAAPAEIRD